MDAVHKAYSKIKDAYTKGSQESDSLGRELHERAASTQAAMVGSTSSDSEPATTHHTTVPSDHVGRKYGDRPGEKVIDTKEMTRPLGSFEKGTNFVPQTGVYKLHKGEKVIPAPVMDNDLEDEFMEHSPEEKAHFHRAMSHLHKGALHRHFGIPEDQPIPMSKKQEAANSSNKHVAAMGRLAVAMHGWGK